MVVLYVSILILFVAINYMMAMRMQAVVEQKGHHNVRVVALCFWLGIVGYLYVIALPDLEERRLLKHIAIGISELENGSESVEDNVEGE